MCMYQSGFADFAFYECSYPVILAPSGEKSVSSAVNWLDFLVENQLAKHMDQFPTSLFCSIVLCFLPILDYLDESSLTGMGYWHPKQWPVPLCHNASSRLQTFKKIYLLEKQNNREVEQRDRQASSIPWFISQVILTARSGPGQSQEPGTQSWCPTWVAGTQVGGSLAEN